MRRLALSTCLVLAALGCESNDAKLQRLQVNAARADATLDGFRQMYWSASLKTWIAKGAALDSVRAAERQSLLAHRDLNTFMSGR